MAGQFDRSAILRKAHAETRRRMQPTREFNYSLDWCPTRRLYVQPLSYRQVLSEEMKKAWSRAKPIVRPASSLTEAERAAVAHHHYMASIEPFTGSGTAAWRASYAMADQIIKTAAARQAAR